MVCQRQGFLLKLSEPVKFSAKLSALLILALQTVKRTDWLGDINSGGEKVLFNIIQSKKTIKQPKPQPLRNGGVARGCCWLGERRERERAPAL